MAATYSFVAPTTPFIVQAASGTQYSANSSGLITGVPFGPDVDDLLKAGCQFVAFNNFQTVFGGGSQNFLEEGNLYRNIGNPIAGNLADTIDDIIAGFRISASSFDKAGRGICITAQGKTGATSNNKQIKLWINPTMSGQTVNSDGSISGGLVGSAGSGVKLIDTGTTTINAKGWGLYGNLFKYGAAGSNTQYFQGNTILDTTHGGLLTPSFLTQPENATIDIVVTGASGTTGAANDVLCNFFEINAMN